MKKVGLIVVDNENPSVSEGWNTYQKQSDGKQEIDVDSFVNWFNSIYPDKIERVFIHEL